VTWDAARLAAAGRTLGPLQGHLATFTSQAEVDAVKNKFGTKNAWIGASDAATEGDWKWVAGLEAGTSFWSGAANGTKVNNAFFNWNSGEPNDSNNEDYAQLNGHSGRWNDNSGNATANGYLVEYSQEFNAGRSPFSSSTAGASLELQKQNQAPSAALPGSQRPLVDLGTNSDDDARSVVIQNDGKILIAGFTTAQPVDGSGSSKNYGVVRLNANGALDTTFGSSGKALLDLGNNTADDAYSLVTQSDGKILIAGFTTAQPVGGSGSSKNYGVVRLNANGILDTTFGSSGKALLDLGNNTADYAYSLVTQSDGKILIAGYTDAQPAGGTGSSKNYGVVRLNIDGTLDSSFGSSGKALLDLGNSTADEAKAVVTQRDGKILIAGYTDAQPTGGKGDSWNYGVVRLNANGSLDKSFGTSGKALLDLGSNSYDYANSVVMQSDGKVLIAGTTNAQSTGGSGSSSNYGVVRLDANGTLDTTFGSSGKALLDLGANSADDTYSVVTQSDGKILIAGITTAQPAGGTGTSNNYGVVRLNADGILDTSFGELQPNSSARTGKVLLDLFTNSDDRAYSVVTQSDGRILIAGSTNAKPEGGTGTSNNYVVVRLNTDGTLDSTFGITSLDGKANYLIGSAAVALDENVTLSDSQLAALNNGAGNYNGARLVLQRDGGANPGDVFSALNKLQLETATGSAPGRIVLGNTTATSSTLAIGSWTQANEIGRASCRERVSTPV
jgi:uncharacterized delta-60 repeat protein